MKNKNSYFHDAGSHDRSHLCGADLWCLHPSAFGEVQVRIAEAAHNSADIYTGSDPRAIRRLPDRQHP